MKVNLYYRVSIITRNKLCCDLHFHHIIAQELKKNRSLHQLNPEDCSMCQISIFVYCIQIHYFKLTRKAVVFTRADLQYMDELPQVLTPNMVFLSSSSQHAVGLYEGGGCSSVERIFLRHTHVPPLLPAVPL